MTRQPWSITRDMFLSEEEVRRLLGVVEDRIRDASARRRTAARLDEFIIHALLFSGLRTSEFCGLRVRDVEMGRGRRSFFVQRPAARRRHVFVPSDVGERTRRYLREVRPAYLPAGVARTDSAKPLVYNEHRRPFERTGLYRRVVAVLRDAGLGDRASVQLLRHTYGYLAYKRTGGNLLFVQRQLGHAHPMITAIYSQFVDQSYSCLADRVGGAASAPGRPPAKPRKKPKKRRGEQS